MDILYDMEEVLEMLVQFMVKNVLSFREENVLEYDRRLTPIKSMRVI